MLLTILILVPFIGIFLVSAVLTYNITTDKTKLLKITALAVTIVDLIISLIMFILYDNSNKNFQFVQEHYEISYYEFYLGVDGLSIYFVLLTTLIMPISIISNWKSLKKNTTIFLLIILMLEASLLTVFLILDILMFYIFFESILAPLFILIGIYGSSEKVRASFYFFLYTLLGSLFMLLSIISMLSLVGSTSFDILSKTNFVFITQVFLFIGIFIAFAVKTPVIYLNSWLLKAHVESPLSGSIILAAIVLKLSLYGIFRLILVLLPKAFIYYTYIIFIIGVLTIIYASLSTIRTIDVKELIAYSSVSHAAVYLLGAFSNVFQGIQGAISLGLAHGFVSSGLFICAGGVLYDRSSTRLITYYRGIAQIMPIFCILFFILSLGNCGVPLTFNFLGEFLSLYGVFERLPMAGVLASSSVVLSAAYTIFMYNRIAFAGSYFIHYWNNYLPDVNKREFFMLLTLVLFAIILGIYPAIILDGLHYSTYCLLFSIESFLSNNTIHFDSFHFGHDMFYNILGSEYSNYVFTFNIFHYIVSKPILYICIIAIVYNILMFVFALPSDNSLYINWHIVYIILVAIPVWLFFNATIFVFLSNNAVYYEPGYAEYNTLSYIFRSNYNLVVITTSHPYLIIPYINMPGDLLSLNRSIDFYIGEILQLTNIWDSINDNFSGEVDYDEMEDILNHIKTLLSVTWKLEVIVAFHNPNYERRPEIEDWLWVNEDVIN